MSVWRKYLGAVLIDTGAVAIGDACCCAPSEECCAACPALSGYTGDLCITYSGVSSGSQTLSRSQVEGQCDSWLNPGNVAWTGCFDGTNLNALDVAVTCAPGGTPKITLDYPDGEVTLTNKGVSIDPDTLDCGTAPSDPLTFEVDYTASGDCSGTLSISIVKC